MLEDGSGSGIGTVVALPHAGIIVLVYLELCVTGTGTMVTDEFALGLVWFQDTSLRAVALLCRRNHFDT